MSGRGIVVGGVVVAAGIAILFALGIGLDQAAPEDPVITPSAVSSTPTPDNALLLPEQEPDPALPLSSNNPAPPVDLSIEADARIKGRVYNEDTNAGVHSVTIVATWTGGELKTKTDNDGRYRFERLPSGNRVIQLEAGTGVPGVPHEDTNRVRVTLRPDGHARELDFPLELGLTLSGHVRDRHGAPIEGAHVNGKHSAFSDSEGAFSVAGYQAGDEAELNLYKSEFAGTRFHPFRIPPGGLSGVRIELVPESVLSGTVVDRNGNPVMRALVEAIDEYRSRARGTMQRKRQSELNSEAERNRVGFELRGLPSGTYRLFARQMPDPMRSLGGFGQADRTHQEGPLAEVSLAEGQHLTGLRLVMDSDAIDNYKDSAQKISGYVRNSEGEPVANARLDPSYFDAQLTDANGYFEVSVYSVEGQPSGSSARLEVSAKGYSSQWVGGIDSSVSTRDIVLKRLGRLVGRVVDAATDEPIQSFEVAKGWGIPPEWDPDRWNFEAVHDSKGRFLFDNLEGRSVHVAVRAPGYSPNHVRVSVDDGTETEVEVQLEPGWPIEGVVLDPEGEPVVGAQVRTGEPVAHLSTGSGNVVAFTDPDGSFYIDPIPSSVTQLFAYHEGYLPTLLDYAHDPDHTTYITVHLDPGSTVEGTISFAGVPVANQRVSLSTRGEWHRGFETRSDARGHFQFPGLRPGEADFSAGVDTDETDYNFNYRVSIPESGVITRDVSVGDYNASLEGYVDGLEAYINPMVRIRFVTTLNETVYISTSVRDDGYYRMDYLLPGS